jgi:transcription elongation GreA/GreB family factor
LGKSALIRQIIAALEMELEGYARSARSAHAGATDEQSKAENKYDTRGLEASYLARGQSRQAAEVVDAIHRYRTLATDAFGPGEPVDLGALVEVEDGKGRELYFLGPRAGGLEITMGKRTVLVLTPQSPLGQQLVGRKQGDRFEIQMNRTSRACRVIAVS